MTRFLNIFLKLLIWTSTLILLLLIAGLGWLYHGLRPVCREDRYPAPRPTMQAPNTTQTQLKLLTWNIQMLPALFGTWIAPLDKLQYQRATWIIEYLQQQDYDVICLQEAFDPHLVKALVDGLSPTYPYAVLPRYGKTIWQQSNGVLILARIPIKFVANIIYPQGDRIEQFAAKGCTLVEGLKEGLSFQLAGTHFQTGKDRFKEAASQRVAQDLLKPHRKPNTPQFLVGDLNIKKESAEYAHLLQYTGMVDFPIDDPRPYTSDAQNSWKKGTKKQALIDHVLLAPEDTATTITTQHIQRATHNDHGKTIDLSDHYGVIAEITLKN